MIGSLDFSTLMATNAPRGRPNLAQAAQQFETMWVEQVLRQAAPQSESGEAGAQQNGQLFENMSGLLAREITESKALGLAKQLEICLRKQA